MPKVENRSMIGLGFREVCRNHKAALTLALLITAALIGYAIKGNLTHLRLKKIDTDLGRGLSAAGIGLLALTIACIAFYKLGKKTPEGLKKMREELLQQEQTPKVLAKLEKIQDQIKKEIEACNQEEQAWSLDEPPAPIHASEPELRAEPEARGEPEPDKLNAEDDNLDPPARISALRDQATESEKQAHQVEVANIAAAAEKLGQNWDHDDIETFIFVNKVIGSAGEITIAEACNPSQTLRELFSLGEECLVLQNEYKRNVSIGGRLYPLRIKLYNDAHRYVTNKKGPAEIPSMHEEMDIFNAMRQDLGFSVREVIEWTEDDNQAFQAFQRYYASLMLSELPALPVSEGIEAVNRTRELLAAYKEAEERAAQA